MPDKVLVAMSGGVDSSVALIKILEAGYEPIGITMKLWDYQTVGGNVASENSCCGIEEINGAKLVCNQFDVPHYTIDFTKVFRETVVNNFAQEYLAGRTPNPCVRCNSFVKWDAFVDQADALGAKFVATGHYAQIIEKDNDLFLAKGIDTTKDQSYVLWGIPRHTIKRTLFPLGDLTKPEVREIAADHDIVTAKKPESMEICFVADNNYNRFLKEFASKEMEEITEGNIVENGTLVGKHKGYTHYTVGQRKGLGLSNPEPRYVKNIDATSNTITVSKKFELYSDKCFISQVNWLVDKPELPCSITIQIRYNSPGTTAVLTHKNDRFLAEFEEPQLSVTPGQSAVFYMDDIVLGGGIIESE